MKTKGISICFGRGNKKWGAYFGKLLAATTRPRINGGQDKCTLGIRFDIVIGPLVRPIARLYHPSFWKGDKTFNPWNSGNHWFTINIPFCILPFFSLVLGEYSWGNPGTWFGGRTANLGNKVDWQLRLDWEKSEHDRSAWAWNEDGSPKEAWPIGKYKGQIVIEPTIAIRKDMRH